MKMWLFCVLVDVGTLAAGYLMLAVLCQLSRHWKLTKGRVKRSDPKTRGKIEERRTGEKNDWRREVRKKRKSVSERQKLNGMGKWKGKERRRGKKGKIGD